MATLDGSPCLIPHARFRPLLRLCLAMCSSAFSSWPMVFRAQSLLMATLGREIRKSSPHHKGIHVQNRGSAKRLRPSLVNFVPAVACHLCLILPGAFTQPGQSILADPCIQSISMYPPCRRALAAVQCWSSSCATPRRRRGATRRPPGTSTAPRRPPRPRGMESSLILI